MTFIPVKDIDAIMEEHNLKSHLKVAQNALANEVIKDLRGKEELNQVVLISSILYSKISESKLNDTNLGYLKDDILSIKIDNINIMDALINTKLSVSKREAKEFILNNAISLNGNTINDINFLIKPEKCNKKYALLKRGKRNNALIIFK